MTAKAKKTSRRKKDRKRTARPHVLRLCLTDGLGNPHWMTADLLDHSDTGVGVAIVRPLEVGSLIEAIGPGLDGREAGEGKTTVRVAWCLEKLDGTYRAGLEFEEAGRNDFPGDENKVDRSDAEQEDDYYDILQLSPKADPETLHRVYRILAQRYHPDNTETGNEEKFKKVLEAYRVLNDPEQRAAYDVRRRANQQLRWKIFSRMDALDGVDGERRKRRALLSLLYTKRMREPERPGMSIRDLEELLGVPRDHLEFSLWYLKENGFLHRSDRGLYEITVAGADRAESEGFAFRSEKPMIVAPKEPSI